MNKRIWAAMLAIYLSWGSTYLAIHYAVQTIPPFFMTGTRFLVAGSILYVWRRLAGDPAPSAKQWRSGIISGNLLLLGGIGGIAWAEQYVPSSIAALIAAATPLWIVLIEAIRPGSRRPSRLTLLGVVTGLGGIIILVDPWNSGDPSTKYNLWGVIVLLLAALSWAAGSVYTHTADQPKSALLGTGVELLAGSAGSFLAGLATGEASSLRLATITASSLIGLAYLVVVGSLIGFVCYTWLLKAAPITLVSTYAYVNPLIAVMLGSLLAQEVLSIKVLMAAPLILLAVVLIQMKKTDKEVIERRSMAMSEECT